MLEKDNYQKVPKTNGNSTGFRNGNGLESMERALNGSPVCDKDKAMEELSKLPSLYRQLGVDKQSVRKVCGPLEIDFYAGTAKEQIRAARTISAAHSNLTKAIGTDVFRR